MSFKPASHLSPGLRHIFILEVNVRVIKYVEDALSASCAVTPFEHESALLDGILSLGPPDLTIVGLNFTPGSESVWKQIRTLRSGTPILFLMTNPEAEDVALAIRLGATGFLQAPFSKLEIEGAVDEQILHTQAHPHYKQQCETPLGDGISFVRSSKLMQDLERQAALVARSDIPVLILGESGTGKEVLAKYTHLSSHRGKKIFLKVNCAAMPTDLLESELFGYEKGAFTGAVSSKPGKFEICRGGTIFLDEIGEMPATLQAKLLHVLQDGTYSRLGGRETMKTDVRVIAATNINIKAAIISKTFREDLYYRLNGFSLTLPPLRERKDEIVVFAYYFMKKAADKYGRDPLPFSKLLLRAFINHAWPGNLRELENSVNRYLILGNEESIVEEITAGALSESEPPAGESKRIGLKAMIRSVKGNAESVAIAGVLEETRWNRKEAASKMQISYKALLYKIKEYDLTPHINQ